MTSINRVEFVVEVGIHLSLWMVSCSQVRLHSWYLLASVESRHLTFSWHQRTYCLSQLLMFGMFVFQHLCPALLPRKEIKNMLHPIFSALKIPLAMQQEENREMSKNDICSSFIEIQHSSRNTSQTVEFSNLLCIFLRAQLELDLLNRPRSGFWK